MSGQAAATLKLGDAPAGDAADEVEVAVEEVVAREVFGGFPPDLFKGFGARLSVEAVHFVKEQQKRRAAGRDVLVARDLRSDDGFDAELFTQLALQSFSRGLTELKLSSGKLPFEGVTIRGHALADQQLAFADKHTCHNDGCFTHAVLRKMRGDRLETTD
jgi:hypothetical protein